jgi:hypothetical protein
MYCAQGDINHEFNLHQFKLKTQKYPPLTQCAHSAIDYKAQQLYKFNAQEKLSIARGATTLFI